MAQKIVHGSRFVDLTGHRFGRLTVRSCIGKKGKDLHSVWLCLCDCGQTVKVSSNHLRGRRIKSCGCFRREVARDRFKTHGMRQSPEYRNWLSMRRRCLDTKHPHYHRYGGRGIRICERWVDSFENFFADMGPRLSPRHTLDRFPENNGNYEPSNCRWATRKEQNRNKSNTRFLTFQGETKSLAEWAEELGINRLTLASRLNIYGWSVERALSTPVKK